MSDQDKDFEEKFEKAIEQAAEKFLEKRYAQFGRWTLGLIGVALFLMMLHLIAVSREDTSHHERESEKHLATYCSASSDSETWIGTSGSSNRRNN